jgi:hypothetical protein
MTNLLEKSLILGFGIFSLILFFIFITPFLQEVREYKKNEDEDIDNYAEFINQINKAIREIMENPEKEVIKNIFYPKTMNITLDENYIRFDFLLDGKEFNKILSYERNFIKKKFEKMPSKTYQLNVSIKLSLLDINFNN